MTAASERTWDTIVLGAGTSGLVAASILSGRTDGSTPAGAASLLVLDEYPDIGGNHISRNINGYSFDIGSFFFSENSPFFAHFPEVLPHYENRETGIYTVARITPRLKIARYPVDLKTDLFSHGALMPLRYAASALYGRIFVAEDQSAEAFAHHWIGSAFFRHSGLAHYMERMFGEPPARIESSFAHKRMRWVKRNAQFRGLAGNLLRHRPSRKPQPLVRQLVRPRAGFPALYRAAAEALQNKGAEIRLNAPLAAIRGTAVSGFTLALQDGTELRSRRLFSTIPLSRSLPLCGLEVPAPLRTADLLTLFVSFAGTRGFDANVLYNFSTEGQWKRLTMHSDFYGPEQGREYFSLECIMQGSGDTPDARFAEFTALARKTGIFSGDLQLEGHQITGSAYPVYLQGATAAAEASIAQLRARGILSFGRQGGFDYQPTSGVSTIEVERKLAAPDGSGC